jgi:hypothetical protein
MSTYEQDLMTARFAALAPRPLPGDWHDVLDRVSAVPRRRRLARSLWRGSRRRKLVVALAVAVVVAAVAAAAYGTVRVLFLEKGFIGLPPVGATPSAPESGELVVHGEGWIAAVPPSRGKDIFRVWVYADGRVIWDRRPHVPVPGREIPEGANEFTSGYLEQRLTPEGVELVRSAVAELFDRTRTLLETVPADHGPRLEPGGRLALFVPNDYPSSLGSFKGPDGDRLVRLQAVSVGGDPRWDEFVHEHFEGTIATPEQLLALRRVDALLTDPASVLPSSAWAARNVRAYVPSHYAVCIHSAPPVDASALLSMLPARAAELLRAKSPTRFDGNVVEAREGGRSIVLGQSVEYCYKVETEEARELADALSALEPESGWKGYTLAYRVAEAVNNLGPTWIWFEPYFPDGRLTFSGPFG